MDIRERVMNRIWSIGKQIEKNEATIKWAESLGLKDEDIVEELRIKTNLLRSRRAELSDMLCETYGIDYPA